MTRLGEQMYQMHGRAAPRPGDTPLDKGLCAGGATSNRAPLPAPCTGWFTEPSPFIEGGLEPEAAVEALNEALDGIFEEFEAGGALVPLLAGGLPFHMRAESYSAACPMQSL